MSTFKRLAIEGRLSKNAWRVIVYLSEIHREGKVASNLEALDMAPATLQQHTGHLGYKGVIEPHPNGGWNLSAAIRRELGIDLDARDAPQVHPFLQREREQQRAALAEWYETGKRRELLKPLIDLWQNGKLSRASTEALDRAELAAQGLK